MVTGGEGLEAGARAARRLADAGRLDEAVAVCEGLVARYPEDGCGESHRWLASVLLLECWCLGERGDPERLLAVGAELQLRYADADDDYLLAAARLWMSDAVWTLLRSGRVPDAIAVSEQLIASFECERDPTVLARVGDALFDVGTWLAWGEPLKARPLTFVVLWALAIGDAIERVSPLALPRASGAGNAVGWVGDRVSHHLRLGGWRCRRERWLQALRSFDVLIERLRDAQQDELQKLLAKAELSRGVALICLGRLGEGRRTFNDVFDGDQQGVTAIVRDARVRDDGRHSPTDLAAAAVSTLVAPRARPASQPSRCCSKIAGQSTGWATGPSGGAIKRFLAVLSG